MNTTTKMVPKDPSGKLHVMLIGRVSTPQQQLANIEAGYAYAKQCLRGIWDGLIDFKSYGEQSSGLRFDRITIVQAYEEIEAGWPDVVLMEDVSKASRNPRFIFAFFQDCEDAGIRVIAPGDCVDTADENWELMLQTAVLRHGMHIPETRRRVRRTASYSFHNGGMVLRVRFGYRRMSKEEAAAGQFGPPGLRMAKVDEQGVAIRHIRDWIVRDKPALELVLAWLTEQGLPPGPYVKSGKWSLRVLLDLLRDPILWGLRRFRRVTYKSLFKSGKAVRTKNATPDEESFPGLAHMTKEQWEELQVALVAMGYGHRGPSGPESPRFRVPRGKSVLPLQWAACSLCGEFMYLAGDDVIKCQDSLARNGQTCWNHVQVDCTLFREKLVDLLLTPVANCPGAHEALLAVARAEIERVRSRKDMASKSIDRQIQDLQGKVDRLGKAIEMGHGDMEVLVDRLKPLSKELKEAKRQRERRQRQQAEEHAPLAPEDQAFNPRAVLLELAKISFEFAALVRKIIPVCKIQPVQALDCGLVRPRAFLTVNLAALMPALPPHEKVSVPPPTEVVIDLFEPPVHIRNLPEVVALKAAKEAANEKASLSILAKELKIGRMTVKRALAYHRLMVAEGLTEPYRVLTAPPAKASRWKPRKRSPGKVAA